MIARPCPALIIGGGEPTRLVPRSELLRVALMAIALGAGLGPITASAQPAENPDGENHDGENHDPGEEGPILEAAAEGPWMDGVAIERQQEARQLFLEGNALAKEAFFGDAAAKYKQALALWDHPAFHFNLAMTQRLLDQPMAAYDSLDQAMRHGLPALGESKFQHAERMREQLASKLGELEVVCDTPGARVTIDGTLLFIGPGRHVGVVEPGEHQIVASKKGHIPDTRPVSLEPGSQETITLRLRASATDEIELERRWPVWMPYTVASTSLIFLVSGSYVASQAGQKFNSFDGDFDPLCDQGCEESQLAGEVQDTLRRGENQRNLGRAIFAGGLVILAGGAVLVYLNRPRPVEAPTAGSPRTSQDERDASRAPIDLSIAPYVTPDGAGVSAGVRF